MNWRFLWLDMQATLRERKTLLAAGLMGLTLMATPSLISRPPPHILSALGQWFGSSDPFTLFLYLWTDLAMNKLIVYLGVVLAGGLLVRERETGVLAVLLSKPMSPATYYVVRVMSACAVMAVLYVGAHVLAAPFLARSVQGFRVSAFFASMAVHLLAALFCVCFSALMAVCIPRRSLSSLVSLLVLVSLVGTSLIGFYNPAWKQAAFFIPFSHGVVVLGHLGNLQPGPVLVSVAVLLGFNAVLVALGAARVRNLEV